VFVDLLQVKELGEAWTWRRRRSVVPTAVLGCGGEGRADDMVLRHGGEGRVDGVVSGLFDVEEERGDGVEKERGISV
jgi:hypothetical protein